MKYRLCVIISGLGTGGAQMMLHRLMLHLDRQTFSPEIIALTGEESFAERFRQIEVPVRFIGMQGGLPDPRWMLRLDAAVRQASPHLVQTWMYHADLLGGLAARRAGIPLVWNIRHSNLDPKVDSRATMLVARACGLLCRFLPHRVICCAAEAKRAHLALGYQAEKMIVIPNGFDLDILRPDPQARLQVRQELGIAPEDFVIGLVGRFHPQKDHATFILAARHLRAKRPQTCFVLCGDGVDGDNSALTAPIEAAGLRAAFRLLGRRDDIPRLTAAFDLATSSSCCGEGFSNTVGEAMACGVPCVATDVGDSAIIIGDSGLVVPPGAPEAFAAACEKIALLTPAQRSQWGERARRRVEERFSIRAVVASYQNLYLELLATLGQKQQLAQKAG
jgi:glycosyltransferase involved in cell wall biosynthesis